MDPTGRCPCIDGLPDPCTLCGAPADGVCGLDSAMEWKFRAEKAEAEVAVLAELLEAQKDPRLIWNMLENRADREAARQRLAAAKEAAEKYGVQA